MTKVLKSLVVIMGVACVAIGVLHFSLGTASVPGEGTAGATVDSRERFYGAIFIGYGLAWIWASRQSPMPATVIRWLAAIFFLGGIGRLVSMAVDGQPNWFQTVLTVVEIALPPLYLCLAPADERDCARRKASAPTRAS